MRIQVVSDLHLEFLDRLPDISNAGADVLILGGDICCADHLHSNPTAGLNHGIQNGFYAKDAVRYREFFDRVSSEWPHVIYIMGNHEHYRGRWDRTEAIMREECARHGNIHMLEKDRVELDGVVFLGATLWSSFNDGDPITMHAIKDIMNDYRQIGEKDGERYHKLRPLITYEDHQQAKNWLKFMLTEDHRPTVVVTHHAPSLRSVHVKYAHEQIMNGAFTSDLDHIMEDHDHIRLWTHGHTHESFDYMINHTRVVCNPHGYPGERHAFNPNLVVEI